MEEKKVWTYEEIMALMAENAKGFAELREQQKRREEEQKRREEEQKRREEEQKRREEERDKEREKELSKLEKSISEVSKNIDGLNKSAGMIAEETVLDYLTRTLTFGGVHFDSIQQNSHSKRTVDGEKIEAEYDVLMLNDASVCIIETKSRARQDDIKNLVENKAAKFKKLFPIFANHKLYLGIAAMSFEEGVSDEAKNFGIGILKPKGDFVEVYDNNLKIY